MRSTRISHFLLGPGNWLVGARQHSHKYLARVIKAFTYLNFMLAKRHHHHHLIIIIIIIMR